MHMTRTRTALLITALSIAAFVLPAATADAATAGGVSRRDALIEACIAKAQAEAPIVIPGTSGNRRVQIYKSCMVAAGARP